MLNFPVVWSRLFALWNASMCLRNRIEEEIRENHPFFDRPLFAVGRDSRLRRICQEIVYAKYLPEKIDNVTGKQIQRRYKQLQ